MGGKEVAKMWIWVGEGAREFDEKINERARKVAQAYSTVPILVRYRFEPRELVEVFGDQITICRGTREDFNHLDTKLYTVQAHEEVVFVEEVAPVSRLVASQSPSLTLLTFCRAPRTSAQATAPSSPSLARSTPGLAADAFLSSKTPVKSSPTRFR